MTSYIIENTEEIRRRLEEIEAEQKLALTGSSAPASGNDPDVVQPIDYSGMYGLNAQNAAVSVSVGSAMDWQDIYRMYVRV